MSEMIWHETVPLCPHIIGYFRNDIPPEEHQTLTAECEECGTVTASALRAPIDRPGFGMKMTAPGSFTLPDGDIVT